MFGYAFTAQLVSRINNSDLEGDVPRFLLENRDRFAGDGMPPSRQFIELRLNLRLTKVAAGLLAEWIANQAPLSELDKLQYLSQINLSRTYDYVRALTRGGSSKRNTVVKSLTQRPNLVLDRFLINTYTDASDVDANLIQAMLICDTPKMHAFLDKLWDKSMDGRVLLLKGMRKIEEGNANLIRWTEPISEIAEPSRHLLAIPVLSQIDTPEAAAILASWTTNTE